MSVSVTWHGHFTFTLDVDGQKVLLDPFFSSNPVAKVKADDVAADFILLTHGHFDHVEDALAIAKRAGALVIANFEIGTWFNEQGHDKVHKQQIGGSFEQPFGRVKLTIAHHGSVLPDGTYGGLAAGFLLDVGGKRIYIAGDTALFSDMQLYAGGLDLAILPIGDNFTMGPDDSLQAIKWLQPKVVIPCHYNTWPPIAVDVQAWARRVEAETDSRPVVLGVEETYSV